MSAETSNPTSLGDPGVGLQTPPEGVGQVLDSMPIPYVANPFGNPISGEVSITTPPDGIVKEQCRSAHRRPNRLPRSTA